MSNASIGRAALVLSTNSQGLASGLNQAEGQIKGFVGRSSGTLSGLKSVGKSAALGLVMGMGAGIGIAGVQAVGDAVSGIVNKGMERLPELARQGTTAQAFGLDVESWTRMSGAAQAAGGDVREFIESMVTINKLTGDAAAGTPEASKAFQTLGLDAAQVAKLPLDEKFYKIMDAISQVPNAADRMRIAGQALGEDGMKTLIPLIGKTSDEIKAMGGRFIQTADDTAKAQLASEAMTNAQASVSKAFDRVLIALTPVFQYVSDLIPAAIDALAPTFSGFSDYVVPAMKGATVAAGYLWDTIKAGVGIVAYVGGYVTETFGLVLSGFQSTIEDMLGGLSDAFKYVKELVSQLPDSIKMLSPGLMAIDMMSENTFDEMKGKVGALGEELRNSGEAMKRFGTDSINGFGTSADSARKFFDDFESKRNSELKKRSELLKKRGGMGDNDKDSGPGVYKGNDALAAGSKAAMSAVLRAEMGGLAQDKDKAQLNATKAVEAAITAGTAAVVEAIAASEDGGYDIG